MRRRLRLAALMLVVAAWNAALVAAPASESPALSAATYLAGSLVCHQQPDRSFHREGAQYPVCARCLGLYLGAGLGVVAWAMLTGVGATRRPRGAPVLNITFFRGALVVTALPTLITVALAWAGVWDASNTVRAALAVPLGAVTAAVIAAVAAEDLR